MEFFLLALNFLVFFIYQTKSILLPPSLKDYLATSTNDDIHKLISSGKMVIISFLSNQFFIRTAI